MPDENPNKRLPESSDAENRANAAKAIWNLGKSERGRECLRALGVFLANDGTYSLDYLNQSAVVVIILLAFDTPSIREMVRENGDATRPAPPI